MGLDSLMSRYVASRNFFMIAANNLLFAAKDKRI